MIAVRRAFLLCCVIVTLSIVSRVQPAYACSGPGPAPKPIQQQLDEADYVVQARIIELDDANMNAFVEVEQYLAGGTGPRYILWQRASTGMTEHIRQGRLEMVNCVQIPQISITIGEVYLFLKRQPDGSYRATRTDFGAYSGGYTIIHVPRSPSAPPGELDLQVIDENTYLHLIASLSGNQPTQPNSDTPFPLPSPLLLVSNTGDLWMLPVDALNPVSWEHSEAVSSKIWIANRGRDLTFMFTCDLNPCAPPAAFTDSNTFDQINYLPLEIDSTSPLAVQGLSLSPTLDTAVVWHDCDLELYGLDNPRLLRPEGNGPLNSIQLVSDSSGTCTPFHKQSIWSPDGHMLAYQDGAGLWLWDTLLTQPPQLLLPSTDTAVPQPHLFSSSGRYLAIQVSDQHFTLDLKTNQHLPYGVVSPDERLIVTYEPDPIGAGAPKQICSLNLLRCVPMRLGLLQEVSSAEVTSNNPYVVYEIDVIQQVIWRHDSNIVVFGCVYTRSNVCGVTTLTPRREGWGSDHSQEARAIAYDDQTGQLAVLRDEHTLEVDGWIYDLTTLIPDEIVDVAWLPSLMYYNQ